MTTTYYLTDTNSDFTGGATFTKSLEASGGTANNITISLGPSASEENHAYTIAGEPSTRGTTGDYSITITVATADSDVYLSVAMGRVNSTNTAGQRSSFTSEQQLSSTGAYTFNLSSVDLGTWSSGDRSKLILNFRNNRSNPPNQSVAIAVGGTSSYVVAPWNASEDYSGSVTGSTTTGGTVSGTKSGKGSSTGSTTTGGTIVGAKASSGTASGSNTTGGTTLGAKGGAGTVTGSTTTAGTVTGTAAEAHSGSVTGSTTTAGTALGTKGGAGSATGSAITGGTATGTHAGSGTATGTTTTGGTTLGAKSTSGSTSGSTTSAGTVTGSAAEAHSGSVTGSTTSGGTNVGAKGGAGTATGDATTDGTNVGAKSTTGSITGSSTSAGTVTGSAAEAHSGSVTGSTTTGGSTSGAKSGEGSTTAATTSAGTATGNGAHTGDTGGNTNSGGTVTGSNGDQPAAPTRRGGGYRAYAPAPKPAVKHARGKVTGSTFLLNRRVHGHRSTPGRFASTTLIRDASVTGRWGARGFTRSTTHLSGGTRGMVTAPRTPDYIELAHRYERLRDELEVELLTLI